MSGDIADSLQNALRYSYKLLSYRGRSRKELAERLAKKGFADGEICRAIERLEASGLIDDKARAETLKRTAAETKTLGRYGAALYMKRMGIERPLAEDSLKDYDEAGAALAFLKRRMRTLKAGLDLVSKRRVMESMRRRGFSPDAIRKALSFEEETEE